MSWKQCKAGRSGDGRIDYICWWLASLFRLDRSRLVPVGRFSSRIGRGRRFVRVERIVFGVFIGVVVLKWGVLAERMVLPSWHCPVLRTMLPGWIGFDRRPCFLVFDADLKVEGALFRFSSTVPAESTSSPRSVARLVRTRERANGWKRRCAGPFGRLPDLSYFRRCRPSDSLC